MESVKTKSSLHNDQQVTVRVNDNLVNVKFVDFAEDQSSQNFYIFCLGQFKPQAVYLKIVDSTLLYLF